MPKVTLRHQAVFVIASATAGLTIWAALGFPGLPGNEDEPLSDLSVQELYARVGEALQSIPIYHAAGSYEYQGGVDQRTGEFEFWADGRANVAREEVRFEDGKTFSIYTDAALVIREAGGYVLDSPPEHWMCYGAGAATSALLGCPGPVDRFAAEGRTGRYKGAPVLILVTDVTVHGADTLTEFTRRLYLNPNTYLPIALESSGEHTYVYTEPIYERRTYVEEAVGPADLPAGFFDPDSLGQADSEAALKGTSGFPVYWLGRDGAHRLVLESSFAGSADDPLGHRLELNYRSVDAPHGPILLRLRLFKPGVWSAVTGSDRDATVSSSPCWHREELVLPQGRADIFLDVVPAATMDDACITSDRVVATVYLDYVVVSMTAPDVAVGRNPLNTQDAFEELIRGIKARMP